MQRGKMYFLRIQTTREGVCLVSFEYRFGSKFGVFWRFEWCPSALPLHVWLSKPLKRVQSRFSRGAPHHAAWKNVFSRDSDDTLGVFLVSFEYSFGSKLGGVLAFRVVSVSIAFACVAKQASLTDSIALLKRCTPPCSVEKCIF